MTIAILQARMSSSRLPGKVLKDLLGKPMMQHHIERLQRVTRIEKLVVATSVEASDDPIDALCRQIGVDCFRGSLLDVLDRYYQAARHFGARSVVRVTADCPLTDPALDDEILRIFHEGDFDYVSNTLARTFPIGLDIEVMRFETLEAAWREATEAYDREHVTPFIKTRPERFRQYSVKDDRVRGELRWTVDTPEDFAFVTKVYASLYPQNPEFDRLDIDSLLEANPQLSEINKAA